MSVPPPTDEFEPSRNRRGERAFEEGGQHGPRLDASRRAWFTETLQRDEAGDTGRVQLKKGLECHATDCGFDPADSKGQLKSSSREASRSDLCIWTVALAVAVRDGGGEAAGGSAMMSPTGQ